MSDNKTPETKAIVEGLQANNLVKEDVFKHAHYTIITRAGVDKIMSAQNIEIQYELVNLSEDHSHCLIKAIGKMGDKRC